MRNVLTPSNTVRLIATLTLAVAIGAGFTATAPVADAAITSQGCYAYSPGFATMGTYYKCFAEGDNMQGSVYAYTRAVILKSCTTYAGCVFPLAGSYNKNWFWGNGRWNVWYCEQHNGYYWYRVACTW